MQDEASEDIAKMNAMGPSDKPYFKQSMWELYKNRAPWLLFLMISSTFSSMVIRGYEDALAAVTVLTAYIPMLTDAGGNAGSQSTSTIIRGRAVGDIEPHDLPKILWREFRIAILCGGTHFAVWAPSAQHIAVETEIGTFDLHRTQSAVWECDAPGVQAGMVYQYWVRGANGQSVAHCDPYGTAMTLRPDGRSIVSDAPKGFADDKWMQERTKCFDKPLNIYEVHAGSWRQKEAGSWYTYAELADLQPAYC